MADPRCPRIHSSAVISAEAQFAPDVQVGANCVIEGDVRIGPGCRIDAGAYLFGPLVLGSGNRVYSQAVLGERAQHLAGGRPMGLVVGAGNSFRARVTVHQGHQATTRIGNRNRFFVGAHVAHDCHVGDDCTFAAEALVGGHCVIEDGVRLGRHSAVHQFCRLGRLSRLVANSVTTKDVPPFILQREHNIVTGINVACLRRRGFTAAQVCALEQLYDLLYQQGMTVTAALESIESAVGAVDVASEFLTFVRSPGRGINFASRND